MSDARRDGEMSSAKPPAPSKAQQLLKKAGLAMPIPLLMLKAAVAPTIALAMYQSDAVASEYGVLGYIVSIASVVGFAIFPRARFIQMMLLNTFTVCIAAAMILLSTWTAIQARKHTTPPGQPLTGYNSSASVVLAIWLYFQIFLVNAIRSKLPHMMIPVIMYTVFANIALTNGTQFGTTAVAVAFVKTLIKSFLTGFALAAGVHFLVFPTNARTPVWGEMTGMLGAMRRLVDAQMAYMHGLEYPGVVSDIVSSSTELRSESTVSAEKGTGTSGSASQAHHTDIGEREVALNDAIKSLLALVGKLQVDLPFAKREFAYGKMGSQEMDDIMKLLQDCMLPLTGLGSLADITHRAAQGGGWGDPHAFDEMQPGQQSSSGEQAQENAFHEWQKMVNTLFSFMTASIGDAITHIMLVLELHPSPQTWKQQNSRVGEDSHGPGGQGFAAKFEQNINIFYENRQTTLQNWCAQYDVDSPARSFEARQPEHALFNSTTPSGRRHRYQIYVILYQEYLLYAAAKAILKMVQYADSKVADGTMSKKRFLAPGGKRIRKWLTSSMLKPQSGEDNVVLESDSSESLNYGEGYKSHDPDHRPPSNAVQRLGNAIRIIPHILRSKHCAFGFRAACATMSVAIICYLRDTQAWFIEQRLVWACIMVAFSMQRTSGQSLFQFVMRAGGTLLAMVASYVVWYIVDGHTAGVLVFQFLFIASCFWVLFNRPRYIILSLLAAITCILIIGYELQVRKIGKQVSESNSQPAYPLYELAPYRLATVVGGLFVAYLWTMFPYPISEHAELRREVAATMGVLARYYSMVRETVQLRTRDGEGNLAHKTSPGYVLEKTRNRTFAQMQMLLTHLHEVNSFTPWQLNIGGAFSHDTYVALSNSLERIARCAALIGYASTSFRATHSHSENSQAEWLQTFKSLVASLDPTSHAITTRLCVLSASLSAGTPLPPYMPDFEAFQLAKRVQALDQDILSVRHLAEPGYAAFAVLQIASRTMVQELNHLTGLTRTLVGEMDFRVAVVEEGR